MIVGSNHRDSYLEMQEYVLRLLDSNVSQRVAILCSI